jgi:1-acyl-sn-glycerol-3-phosphate acyltransferase
VGTAEPPRPSEPFERADDAARSCYELGKLVLLGITLAPLRVVAWVAVVLPLYALCRATHALGLPIEWVRTVGCWMARITLYILGFYRRRGIRRYGVVPEDTSQWVQVDSLYAEQWAARAGLIVSNHVSWLDILFFMSEGYCPSFVAKSGWIKAPCVPMH